MNHRNSYSILSKSIVTSFLIIALIITNSCTSPVATPKWPASTHETKPWSRWWWHGNVLTKEGITSEMEAYQKAGLGGLEITPIYGVMGYEDQFIDYLSPRWMELFLHTLQEAKRLGLGIDMATGTGWPFGGPWVNSTDASKNIQYKIYSLKAGEQLQEKIEFMQEPYLRAVANQVYEVDTRFSAEKPLASGTANTPATKTEIKKVDIGQLVEPIGANKNLQALGLEQVQFKKPLALTVLMGYNDQGDAVDLTTFVDAKGKLNWTPAVGNWKLYALFEGWHGKMVERAGPGGEGYVIDHFSADALTNYFKKFESAFEGNDISALRAFFNDSYEVDDAKGTANWTPTLFDEFKKRRGYDLQNQLPALFALADAEKNERVLCDYRETISEMLLENFTQPWKAWAHSKSAMVRNQAHGSPANILDLYATVDIPEIEGVEPLRIKMASSAANVTGKKLVSSESATWLNEHFESNLSDIKSALDRFMLNGVNHIFYHGTAYSPPHEPWPGWLFYAAVHLNPRNSLWKDFDALNNYVTRCQSFLQTSTADNDALLYYPVYDRFSTPGKELIEHFDGIGKQFENTAFERSAKVMMEKGYSFDYISDKQIIATNWINESLQTEGNSFYKTLVIPHSKYIPISTFLKIISLAEQGATLIAAEGLPQNVAGFGGATENQKLFQQAMNKLTDSKEVNGIQEFKIGKGRILVSAKIDEALRYASVRNETLVDLGIDFIRKKETNDRTVYFISNHNTDVFEGWLPLSVKAHAIALYDPMTGNIGKATTRKNDLGQVEIFVRLHTQQTLLIETYQQEVHAPALHNYSVSENIITLNEKWNVQFTSGGPALPPAFETDSLRSWTDLDDDVYKIFSGTASYQVAFTKPSSNPPKWLLDLGEVHESAEVILNGKSLGKLIGPVYQVYIEPSELKDINQLEVNVTNGMANRIADLDKRNVYWKKFYNINFPARKAANRMNGLFDASGWEPGASGLIGPVTLSGLKKAGD